MQVIGMPDAFACRTSNSRRRKLHTDRDCQHLKRCEGVVAVDPERQLHVDWCKRCTGDYEPASGHGEGHYESLLAHAGEG